MDIETYRNYCLSKKGVEECFPFDETTLVFKVMNKMFALTGLDNEVFTVNLKCDPEWSEELRATYSDIVPGWHMNKTLWNTVNFESAALSDKMLKKLIDHSYDEVIKKLPKKLLKQLEELP